MVPLVPPAGLEPTHPAPEAGALSTELRGQHTKHYITFRPRQQAERASRIFKTGAGGANG